MSFASEASKLLTNKYFLYFMVFLSASNVLGYLVMHRLHAIAFFGLVSFLTYQFSKNMSVVLLVALIATNFMMSNRMMREGLENAEGSSALENVESKDPEIAATLPIVKGAKDNDDVKKKIMEAKMKKMMLENSGKTKEDVQATVNTALSDVNNTDLNQTTEEVDAPKGFSQSSSKKNSRSEEFRPRLDYSATIDESYQNLDNILGSDSIRKLTDDTQRLMGQQQKLYDTMQNMVPVLQGAQNLLKDFKIEGLTESLKGIGLGKNNDETI
jgi:hypothetical protein